MSEVSVHDEAGLESLVTRVADEFLERQKRGERPTVEQYAARYPEAAELLRKVLCSLDLLGLSGAAGVASAAATEAPAAGVLGDFRVLREVGRGGMGVVYEAEQISLGRRVALKVLPFAAALDAKQLQRFKNEAQAAACLHHGNIVPVYAVGCERAVHFYAMQYIEGQTLAATIAELRRLAGREPEVPPQLNAAASQVTADLVSGRWAPAPQRTTAGEPTGPYAVEAGGGAGGDTPRQAALASSTEQSTTSPAYFRTVAHLGIQAAEALEHAHQLGIVHRDIKPANLLVDGRGHLWVTDFGLAHCQSQAGLTMTGDLVGTLRYMSPEQALAQRVGVDHRTDVYSLGATLYELLTLEPTFPGKDRQELLRQIAFEEPRKPRGLNRAVPAELETIVLKLLEKSPADRYATAQEVADDLRRFLDDRPIRARRPSVLARLRKWSRRHRGAVAGATVAADLVLLEASAFCAWQWRVADGRRVQAEEAERTAESRRVQAEKAEEKAQAVSDFLIRRMIEAADPDEARGQRLTVKEVLDKAAKEVGTAFADQPEVEAAVRLAIGGTYNGLGLYREALPHLRRALELRRRVLGPEHRDTLQAVADLGGALRQLHEVAAAEALFRDALEVARRVLGDDDKTTLILLHQYAWILGEQERVAEAVELERQCLEGQRRVFGPADEETLATIGNLANHLLSLGQWDEGEKFALEGLRLSQEAFPKDHPIVLTMRAYAMQAVSRKGDAIESERLARDNMAAAERVWGHENIKTGGAAQDLAEALWLRGKFAEAEQRSLEGLEIWRRIGAPDDQSNLGHVLMGQGRWADAEAALTIGRRIRSRQYGPGNPLALFPFRLRGEVLQALGRREEAGKILWASLEAARKLLPSTPPHARLLYTWAEYLLEGEDFRQAEKALDEALAIQRKVLPPKHRDAGLTLAALGWARTCRGRPKDGEPLLYEGLELLRRGQRLGNGTTTDPETQRDWAVALAESRLGGCLTAQRRFEDAAKLLLNSYPTLEQAPGEPPQRRVEAADRIIRLYETWGKPAEAAAWRAKRSALPNPKGAGDNVVPQPPRPTPRPTAAPPRP